MGRTTRGEERHARQQRGRRRRRFVAAATAGTMLAASVALASDLDVATLDIDTNAPVTEITLEAGDEYTFKIEMSITGQQNGNATFKLNRDWVLEGGSFTGSNPQSFEVSSRSASAQPTVLETTGKLTVAADQPAGAFTLRLSGYDFETSSPPALKMGTPATLGVSVRSPAPADIDPPTWECLPAAAGANWQAVEGTHECTASDESGLAEGTPATFTLSTNVGDGNEDGNASTGTQELCDIHGNCTIAGPITGWKIDRKAPTITDLGPTAQPNEASWYRTDVTNRFSASDGGSGLEPDFVTPFEQSTSGEGVAVTVSSGPVSDVVGNENTGIASAAFQIDKTAPTVTCDSPAPTYTLNESSPVRVTATVSDSLSGPKEMAVGAAPDVSTVGTRTVRLTGEDFAGNTAQADCSYSVGYAEVRLLQPVRSDGTSVFKRNATVPLKFELRDAQGVKVSHEEAQAIADRGGARVFLSYTGGTNGSPNEDVVSTSAHSGTEFRYDEKDGQFIFNLSTRNLTIGSYDVIVKISSGGGATFDDGIFQDGTAGTFGLR
jgi:hypothetical protein